jgi:hypothetical protein
MKQLAIGVLAGLVIGGTSGAMATTSTPDNHDIDPPKNPTISGEGWKVDCKGNGKAGYRRCDVWVDEPGPVHRVDYYIHMKGWNWVSLNVWGLNPETDYTIEEGPSEVVPEQLIPKYEVEVRR